MMKNNAVYMDASSFKKTKPASFKSILSFFMAGFFIVVALLPTMISLTTSGNKNEPAVSSASALEWNKFMMCEVFPEPADRIYQYASTTDLQFAFRSKSAMTSGADKVDSFLNGILNLTSVTNINELNSHILGYNVTELTEMKYPVDMELDPEERFNKGAHINPFDRFGVAGLTFSGYMGEWRHVVIDACAQNTEPSDPKAGLFYEDRLEPRSVWADISDSKDPRTKIFNKGYPPVGVAFMNIVANWIFTLAKIIVVLTVALVGIAFSDIITLIGLDTMLGSSGGFITALFNSVFMPFIVLIFVFVGVSIIRAGASGKTRQALSETIRSIVLFFLAIFISFSPGWLITLPNNLSMIIQAVTLSAMNNSLSGGGGMCATDIGSFEGKILSSSIDVDYAIDNPDKTMNIIEQASTTIRSSVGCQMWQMLLLKPWAQAQYGTDWNNLWARGEIPDWAPNGATDLENRDENAEMVGDAAVPMGDGTFIHNWALFQISTQTNVHAPIGHEGDVAKKTTGLANDWWRVADVLSGYYEKSVPPSGEPGEPTDEYKVIADDINVSPYWDTWTGGNTMERIWVAGSAVIIAAVGSSGIIIFASLSAIYAIGVTLMIAFAPVVLLVGCFPGQGWEIFKSWITLIVQATGKRIAAGILLVLSIAFTSAALKMMEDIGWIQGILLLIVSMLALIKGREMVFRTMSSFSFAGYSMTRSAQRVSAGMKKTVNKTTVDPTVATGRMIGSVTGGAVAAKANGGSTLNGLAYGLKNEMTNITYRNKHLRNIITQYEISKQNMGHASIGQHTCEGCGEPLDKDSSGMFYGGRDASGKYFCNTCLEEDTAGRLSPVTAKVGKKEYHCNRCGQDLSPDSGTYNFKGGKDAAGNLYCRRCFFDEMGSTVEGVNGKPKTAEYEGSEVKYHEEVLTPERVVKDAKQTARVEKKMLHKQQKHQRKVTKNQNKVNSRGKLTREQAERIYAAMNDANNRAKHVKTESLKEDKFYAKYQQMINETTDKRRPYIEEKVRNTFERKINEVDRRIVEHRESGDENKDNLIPTLPDEIKPYIDEQEYNKHWVIGNYNAVRSMYITAYADRFRDKFNENVINDEFLLALYEKKIETER